MTTIHVDVAAEIRKQGFEYASRTPPEPRRAAPRMWARYDGDRWQAIEPAHGRLAFGVTRLEAYHRAVADLDAIGADVLELASTPRGDEDVFFTDSAPSCKGLPRRKVLLVDPSWSRPTPAEFYNIERMLWAWGRTGSQPVDICEVAENTGIGDCTWRAPRDLSVPMPKELSGVSADRVSHYENILRTMAAAELQAKQAVDIDVGKLAKAALAEHKRTFVEIQLPAHMASWAEHAQALWREVHESLCLQGHGRHTDAPGMATHVIAQEIARQIEAGERTVF